MQQNFFIVGKKNRFMSKEIRTIPILLPPHHSSIQSLLLVKHPFLKSSTNTQHFNLMEVDESKKQGTSILSTSSESSSCQSCLYTGVATCIGISAHFAKIAFYDEPLPERLKHAASDKRFMVGMSGAFAIAGIYRFYLG
mmetsp:Transcript_29573/g.29943  ORF Transcript_29573/g.29943 Transcript_29573/m.29943 type:complete len:139 (-) Transcript_29573:29-445(-)